MKKISLEVIKSFLSMCSLSILAIQHYTGLFANNIQVSYIPLLITFSTIFINTLGENDLKIIKNMSLVGAASVALSGIIFYTLDGYNINLGLQIEQKCNKILFAVIGTVSLALSIFYIRRICKESREGVLE